ncbi:hypothetical protein, partial [Pseudomonas sp. UBA7530]|uniref:hypothetical protein n=1 Tax=Pseudomonas sp. UBA7530 TaxID=1947341 RepID=UPI0025CDBAE1
FLLNHLRFRSEILLSSGRRILQRSKPLSTPLFYRFRSIRPNHQQDQTTTPSTGAHSTRQIQLCKPFIQLNLLINKKFLKRFIAEVARILHPAECASSFNCSFITQL